MPACLLSVVEVTRISFQTSLLACTSSNTAAGSACAERCFVLKAVCAFAETAAGQRERGGHPAAERRGTNHDCSQHVFLSMLMLSHQPHSPDTHATVHHVYIHCSWSLLLSHPASCVAALLLCFLHLHVRTTLYVDHVPILCRQLHCVSMHSAHASLDCGQHDATVLYILYSLSFLVLVMPLFCACHGQS